MPSRVLTAAALALLASAPTGLAHHGFTGRYDISQPLWLEGKVTEVYLGQPHPTVTVLTGEALTPPTPRPDFGEASALIADRPLVVRPETTGREVRIEFPPLRAFFQLGDSVALGDRIALVAYRNCEAPHQLRGQWLQPAAAAAVARSGRARYQVEGC